MKSISANMIAVMLCGLGLAAPAGNIAAAATGWARAETAEFVPGDVFELRNVRGDLTVSTWNRERCEIRAAAVAVPGREDEARVFLDQLEMRLERCEGKLVVRTWHPSFDADVVCEKDIKLDWSEIPGDAGLGQVGRIITCLGGFVSGVQKTVDREVQELCPVEVHYEVRLPERCDFVAVLYSGNIRMERTEGWMELSLAQGDIELENPAGDITVNLFNGKLDIDRLQGALDAYIINGAVDVEISELAVRDHVNVNMVNGDSRIRLPRHAGSTLGLLALNGNIELPAGMRKRGWLEDYIYNGKLRGGGGEVRVNMLNGSISVVD